ncbi:MAG: NUDIX domain-containing protein [Patescibacteria group bacterium]
MKKLHYFIGTRRSPYHLSVGAIVVNRKGEIYCHHFPKGNTNPEFVLLMRKTLKPYESLEGALARGLKEEFGMKARVIAYLGSLESSFRNWEGAMLQKATLYFLCTPIAQDPKWIISAETRTGHFGKGSTLEWKLARWLITQMKKQGRRMKRTDFDESEIVKRFLNIKRYRHG